MRCIIFVALLCAVANASFFNKNRFYRMLNNKYNNPAYLYDQEDLMLNDNDDLLMRGGYECDQKYVDQYGRIRCQEEDILGRGRFDQWDDENDYYNNNYYGPGDVDQQEMMLLSRGDLFDQDRATCIRVRGGECRGPLGEVQDANAKLASQLYKQTKEDKDDKNTVLSPLSVQLALAALNQGARGNTKRQIARVIAGSLRTEERRHIFKGLVRRVKGHRGGDLSTLGFSKKINPITVIAINTRTPAQQWFVQTVSNERGFQVKQCNFHNQPRVCRKMINNLIARKTNMKINQIVPRDAITDNTKMVLVNALEMKAPWGRQMRNHVTKQAKFFPLETNKVKIVEVMETEGRFKYYEDELVKIVGIPTKEHEMTFYTIVPKQKDGLTAVEKLHLQDGEQLKQLLEKTDLHTRRVGVQLPKFQIKHKIDARRTLRKQGVTDCFDPMRADFSGITGMSKNAIDEITQGGLLGDNDMFQNQYDNTVGLGDEKLHLNKFIHQATIKVSENGISAATQLDNINNQYDDQLLLNDFQQRVGGGLDTMMMKYDDMDTFDRVSGLFGGNDLMGCEKMVKANRAFAFVVKHNPTNQLVMFGRVIDAAQKNINNAFQTIDNIDQL